MAAGTLCSLPSAVCAAPALRVGGGAQHPGCWRSGPRVNAPCAHKQHVLALMMARVGKHEYGSDTFIPSRRRLRFGLPRLPINPQLLKMEAVC